jgi:hypothetical protein
VCAWLCVEASERALLKLVKGLRLAKKTNKTINY